VSDARCIGLMQNVLREHPDVAKIFGEAISQIRKEGKAPGCHQNVFRIINNWVKDDYISDLPKTPAHITDTIIRLREIMAKAFETKSYELHFNPEFPVAVRLWFEKKFLVVTFSDDHSETKQKQILNLAIPSNEIKSVKLEKVDADSVVNDLAAYFPEDKNRCFLLLPDSRYESTFHWRKKKMKTVQVGSAPKLYLERGYSLMISQLTDFNPELEMQRDYY
jgi:hypothetical protein